MSQQTIAQVGVFTKDSEDKINANFTELYSSTAGGALTSAHLLVGNSSNVATDTAVTGDVTISNTGVTAIGAGKVTNAMLATAIQNPVVGTVSGVKVASGVTALDGSNPTTVATGLSTITGIGLALNRSTSLASGTAFVTYNNISAGSFDLYGWVVAGTASTGTENVAWVVQGT